jgi:hypothetical protein
VGLSASVNEQARLELYQSSIRANRLNLAVLAARRPTDAEQ